MQDCINCQIQISVCFPNSWTKTSFLDTTAFEVRNPASRLGPWLIRFQHTFTFEIWPGSTTSFRWKGLSISKSSSWGALPSKEWKTCKHLLRNGWFVVLSRQSRSALTSYDGLNVEIFDAELSGVTNAHPASIFALFGSQFYWSQFSVKAWSAFQAIIPLFSISKFPFSSYYILYHPK